MGRLVGQLLTFALRGLISGKVLEKPTKGNEQLKAPMCLTSPVQYLYNDGSTWFFMNQETFEQFELSKDMVEGAEGYLKEGDIVSLQFFESRPINLELPRTCRCW